MDKIEDLTLYESKCVGLIIGSACGDILGANIETLPNDFFLKQTGKKVNVFLETSMRKIGKYTDDTAQMLAVCESLIQSKKLDSEHLSKTFLKVFKLDPEIGYGASTVDQMGAIESGGNYKELSIIRNSNSNGW